MFNPQYDATRKAIAHTQERMLEIAGVLNSLHPASGGEGLANPLQAHQIVAHLAAEVHNVAVALGNVIDVLDQDSPNRRRVE